MSEEENIRWRKESLAQEEVGVVDEWMDKQGL